MDSNFSYLDDSFSNKSLTQLHERGGKGMFDEQYAEYDLIKEQEKDYYGDMVEDIEERSPLSDVFFSKTNINKIHLAIINGIKSRLNMTISKQSTNQLVTIMRYFYLQKRRHDYIRHPTELKDYVFREVAYINKFVIKESIKTIESNLKQQIGYIAKIKQGVLPMAHPVNSSMSGTKTNDNTLVNRMFL